MPALTESCSITGVLVLLAYMGLEYWLGKTQKTKAASLLELVWLGVILIVGLLFLRRKHGRNKVD